MPNTMVVKTCSELWKEVKSPSSSFDESRNKNANTHLLIFQKLSESEKIPFQEEEKKLRAQYHIEANIWKKSKNEKKSWKNDEALEKEMLPLPEAAPHPPGASVFMNPPSYAPRNGKLLALHILLFSYVILMVICSRSRFRFSSCCCKSCGP